MIGAPLDLALSEQASEFLDSIVRLVNEKLVPIPGKEIADIFRISTADETSEIKLRKALFYFLTLDTFVHELFDQAKLNLEYLNRDVLNLLQLYDGCLEAVWGRIDAHKINFDTGYSWINDLKRMFWQFDPIPEALKPLQVKYKSDSNLFYSLCYAYLMLQSLLDVAFDFSQFNTLFLALTSLESKPLDVAGKGKRADAAVEPIERLIRHFVADDARLRPFLKSLSLTSLSASPAAVSGSGGMCPFDGITAALTSARAYA